MTRFGSFLKANNIRPMHLASSAGISRQHVFRLREGTAEPTRAVMVALAAASGRILQRRVAVSELFDLGKERKPEIRMVDLVTIEHGLTFARGWYEGDMADACDDTGIMTWPGGGLENTEAHIRFHNITEEICASVFALVRRPIAEAFVRAANEVLARERRN